MIERLTCTDVDERDLVSRFVSGRLSEEETQAFESHCLECDDCWAELRLALSVHAATAERKSEVDSGPRTANRPWRRVLWRASAIAAGVVLAVAGIRWWWHAQEVQQIERGSGGLAALTLSWTSEGNLLVDWPDIDHAARYVMAVRTTDGRTVITRETTQSQLTLDARVAANIAALVVLVGAYDALGTSLAESDPVPIPPHPPR